MQSNSSIDNYARQSTTLAEDLEIDNLENDTDLFEFGGDSLQVLLPLLNAINAFIVKDEQPMGGTFFETRQSTQTRVSQSL